MGSKALIATRTTVLCGVSGPKVQRFNRTLIWAVAAITVAILAWVGMELADKDQFESNKRPFFLESITWTTYILPSPVSTIITAVVSIMLALVISILLGIGRLGPITPMRWLCSVIVKFFRAIPVPVLMLFVYSVFAIWQLFPSNYFGFAAVMFDLTIYNDSVIDETLCSGIELLPKGQRETVIVLGLSHHQTMVTILPPQAVAAMLPMITSQMVITLKDSTLSYMIGYIEVVRSSHQPGEYYGAMTPSLVVMAITLIIINFGPTNLAERIESQLHAGRVRHSIIAKVLHQRDMGVITRDETGVDRHVEGHRDLHGTHE